MKININVEVKEDGKTLRSFKGLPVNLWDTAKENLEHYGEEMLHLCFIGTSGKVIAQNRIRAYAADMGDGSEYVNTDADVEKFAAEYEVTIGAGSELQSEKASLISEMSEKDQKILADAQALLDGFNKQATGNVKTRKDAKTAKASA